METKQTTYQPNTGDDFMADALLHCPCCGGEPELIFTGNDYTKKRSVTIKCKKCYLKRIDAAISNNSEWCAKVAIEQWNKRHG